jgi:hypothetical protein
MIAGTEKLLCVDASCVMDAFAVTAPARLLLLAKFQHRRILSR